jgi:hypothetical protein
MNRAIPLALALSMAVIASAEAEERARPFQEGTPVVIVGEITSRPRDVGVAVENKMQVAVGPRRVDHTLHMADAVLVGPDGEEEYRSAMTTGLWVRAEGEMMDDPRRIKVTRLRVLGEGPESYRRSQFYRAGWDQGYAVLNQDGIQRASTKPFTRGEPVVLVGRVSTPPEDRLVVVRNRMQVAIGPDEIDHTLHVRNAKMTDLSGQEVARSDFQRDWWVRAEGKVMDDPRRIEVSRLWVLGRSEDEFRRTGYFHNEYARGYISAAATAPQPRTVAAVFEPELTTATPTDLPEGTPVQVVGVVSSQPRDVGVAVERKMQVAIGPDRTDYTLHLRDARMFDMDGTEIAASDFRDRWWVRAVGTVMDDSRRIDVTRLQVLAKEDESFRTSQYYRQQFAHGYVAPTGQPVVRTVAPTQLPQGTPVEVVGVVSSQPRDFAVAQEQRMQVAIGPDKTDYTLHLRDARMFDVDGTEIAASDFRDRWWVRAVGNVMDDSRRIQVDRLQVLAKEDESFRTSEFYRQQFAHGYVMPRGIVEPGILVAGERAEFGTTTYSGTVVSIHRDQGYFILRDEAGREHRIDTGRDANLGALAAGDRVNVRITTEPAR